MSEHEHHHHHHEISVDAVKGRAFFFGIILNTLFVIGEFTAGFIFNSMYRIFAGQKKIPAKLHLRFP